MGFETAYIETEDGAEINVQFNPSEYNISRTVSYADKKIMGTDSPFIQFVAGEAESLKITLMFDTYIPPTVNNPEEAGTDVRMKTLEITKLLEINPSKHRPPLVKFRYGSLSFKGVITDIAQTFTMFLANGIPVRSKLDVTFRSLGESSYKQKPLESPDRTKYCTVHETEHLWNFAWKEYGDVHRWKEIAKANNILDPLDIQPGQIIKLPAL